MNQIISRPIVDGPKCPTRKSSELIDILLKSSLKQTKSFIRDSLGFWNKCRRNLDEDTEIVMFGVINFYTSIPHEFDLETID